MKHVLTDVSVRAVPTPARGQITIWDKSSPLGVRVSQGGARTFIVMVGAGKRHVIGRVGIIPLAHARTESKRIVAERTLGIFRPKPPPSIIFEAALSEYLTEHFVTRRPATLREATRGLNRHFLPPFRKSRLADITDSDIARELKKLAHTPSEQLHAFRAIRAMLRWCTRPPRRYIAHSPLEGYPPPGQDRKRSRVLTDRELTAVWRACDVPNGDLVRLLILWGTRNGETGRLRREWIDDGLLTVPSHVTKNGRAHAIPLLPMACVILDRQEQRAPAFFPGRLRGDSFFKDKSWHKLRAEIERRSGVTNWQLRDLRRTFRSGLSRLGVPRTVCEILLNHVTGANRNELDEIYDRYDYLPEKCGALIKWEQHILKLLSDTFVV